MLSEGAVSAILYGHFRKDSYSTIQQTLQQINLSASLGAISAENMPFIAPIVIVTVVGGVTIRKIGRL